MAILKLLFICFNLSNAFLLRCKDTYVGISNTVRPLRLPSSTSPRFFLALADNKRFSEGFNRSIRVALPLMVRVPNSFAPSLDARNADLDGERCSARKLEFELNHSFSKFTSEWSAIRPERSADRHLQPLGACLCVGILAIKI